VASLVVSTQRMRFLVALPVFVFLTAGCGAQQERINAAQQEYDAAADRLNKLSLAPETCQSEILAPVGCVL
jgi:uncharacterized lipoprotein